ACAGVTARRTTVAWAGVRVRGTGRLLPLRADLVARTVPSLSPIRLMIEAGRARYSSRERGPRRQGSTRAWRPSVLLGAAGSNEVPREFWLLSRDRRCVAATDL